MPNTLRVKRGLAASLPNGASGEPLFTTDTYELYIGKGDGTNQRYQKYIASGTTSQYLRGDGSLETHNLDSLTDVVVSSPSNGQFLKYNGTNWVNSAGGFLTGGATAAGQVGVFDSTTNIVGYTTFTYDTVTDKLSMTNGYVNSTLTVDGQLVIKSESGASAYTRGLKFPDNSYGGTGDIAGLRLHNAGGENIILELYAGNDSLDTINFAVAAGGSTYNDNVTINGNKIWNVGNLPSPLSSTGTINSGEIPIFSNANTVYSDTKLFWDNSLNRLGIGGTSPIAQLGIETSAGVPVFGYRTSGALFYELVMSYDVSSYGHTIQTGRSGTGTNATNLSILNYNTILCLSEQYDVGINTLTPVVSSTSNPAYGINIYSSSNTTSAGISFHTITGGVTSSDGFRIMLRNSGNVFMHNLETGGMTINGGDGNFEIITFGATNFKIESTTGKIGIGNPASIAEMLTVNGSIQQSAVTSAITKTDANGKIVAAVAGTDYVAPSALSGYVPTSRTLTINGTTYDLSANRSWTVGIIDGGGSAGRVTYWSDADTVTSDGGFIYDSSTKRLGVNTTVPNATIGATAASGYGLLIKNADSNYGGIGMGVDATYGNLISTEKLGTAPARNLTLLNQGGYISLDESGNMGVNILTPNASTSGPGGIGIDIYSSTTAALAFHNSTSGTGSAEGGRIYYNSTNMTIRNLESGNISITADNGNFQVITLGAENIKVEGSTGKVGIGAPASIAEMLTVNGSIQQSAVTSSMLKANASGKIIAAVSNTDFQAPITLTTNNTSGAATFNGTTLNIPQYQAAGNYITGAGNSGYLPKYTGSYTIANSLVYDNGSRVMINTTTDNTVEMLQVNGGIRGTSLRINSNANTYTAVNVLGQIYVDNRSSQGGNRIFLTPNTTSTTPYVHFYEPFTAFNTNGGISIGTSNAITTTPTDSIMHWDANNIRVGINKTNPSTTLDVNGAATFSSSVTANGTMQLADDGTYGSSYKMLALTGNTNGSHRIFAGVNNTDHLYIAAGTGRGIAFWTDGSSALKAFISTTGAATFSSSVTAAGITSNNGDIILSSSYLLSWGGSYAANIPTITGVSGAGSYLSFYPAGSSGEKMRITNGGNVGIGTTSPFSANGINLEVANSTIARLVLNQTGTRKFSIGAGSDVLNIYDETAGAERMRITSGGNVSIGTGLAAANSFNFYQSYSNGQLGFDFYNSAGTIVFAFNGNTQTIKLNALTGTGNRAVYSDASGALTNSSSDITLKKNIENIIYGLDAVLSLKPVSYNWIPEKLGPQREIGFIAQEVQEIIPEVIGINSDETLSLDYPKLTAVLVKAIQEQQAQIEELKSKLN